MQAFLPSVFRLLGHYRVAILLLVFVVSVSYSLQGYLKLRQPARAPGNFD